jgi:hypothetical protein
MSEVHTIVAVRLKPRMTILPKRKRTARGRVACFPAQPLWRPRGALLAKPTEGDHQLNTTRPNGSCLCAISQLGSWYELPKLVTATAHLTYVSTPMRGLELRWQCT